MAAAPLFALGVTALFVVYLAAFCVAKGRWSRAARNVVLAFAALFQALALLSPDMLSTDLYSYIFYGRIHAVYHGNPYVEVPAQYPGDPFYPEVYWKFVPTFYGPLWTLVSGVLARLAGEDVPTAVFLFRALAASCALVTATLVSAALERIDRTSAVAGTLLLSWNPLFVVESGLSGHNDILMGLLIVLGVVLLVGRRPALAFGALVLACLVKFVAAALLPLLAVYLARQLKGWRERALVAARAGALGGAITVLVLLPVWAGPATFAVGTLGTGGDRYVNGLGELALGELRIWLGETRAETGVPLQFTGWWVATHRQAPLRANQDDGSELLAELPPWTEVLVVGPEKGGWMPVYHPGTRLDGYVRSVSLGPAERPPQYDEDEEVRARERGPTGSPILQAANRAIRIGGWGAFALVWLGALLLATGSLCALLTGWLAAFLALFYFASNWFWPWYLIWGLVAAALAPNTLLSRWMVLLSWGVLLLYAALGFAESSLWFLQTYRSLAMFGLPVVLLLLDNGARALIPVVQRRLVGDLHHDEIEPAVEQGTARHNVGAS